jgi:hypothetical protein
VFSALARRFWLSLRVLSLGWAKSQDDDRVIILASLGRLAL